jgi:GH43 family beta-xylosidase
MNPELKMLMGGLYMPLRDIRHSAFVVVCLFLASVFAASQSNFANPIIARGADPSVVLVAGIYYSVQSGCQHAGGNPVICIRAARSLPELGKVKPVPVWVAPGAGPNAHDIWAPEIENFDGKWYIYYAADPDANPHHALFALVPRNQSRPLGEWMEADTGAPGGGFQLDWKSNWAIDPSVFKASDSNLYLTFACRQDNTDRNPGRYQSICMAEMSDPLHLRADSSTGKKVVELSLPTQAWENRGFPTEEGPFGFTRDGVDYILYSGSFSGAPDDYAEGLLINRHPPQLKSTENPLLNPASWVKEGPVFDGHHASYGTASSVLVTSPDHTELWQVYHGTDCVDNCTLVQNKTWADRSVRAQKAGWSATGDLVLGYPVDIEDTDGHGKPVPLAPPSTDGKGHLVLPPWGTAFGDAAEGDMTDGAVTGKWTASGPGAIRLDSLDGSQLDKSFYTANPNFQNYVVYTHLKLLEKGSDTAATFGIIGAYVDHNDYFLAMVEPQGCGANGCLVTQGWVAGQAGEPLSCPLPEGFSPHHTNVLAVEAVSGTFNILINDHPLEGPCQGRHFSLDGGQVGSNGSNGQAGVAAENAKVAFTSFMVSPGVPVDSQKYATMFAFRNVQSQMEIFINCRDCKDAKNDESADVIQFPAIAPYPLTAWPGQIWKLKESGRGFSIINSMTNLCLDVATEAGPDSLRGPDSAVERRCNGKDTQQWMFLPVPQRSSFVVENEATQTVLDLASMQRGALLKLQLRTDQPSQMWQLVSP